MLIHRQRIRAEDIPVRAHTMDIELSPLPRYPGAHVSTILRYIGVKTGILKDYDAQRPLQEDRALADHGFRMNFMMMMGLAWESWLFRRLVGISWQPGEQVRDQIGMNCDGLNFNGWWDMPGSQERGIDTDWLEECKVTWQSVNNKDVPGWYRLEQIKAYCGAFGLTRAKLWIYHVQGNYKEDFGPHLYCHWIEFTQQELDRNWQMILEGKREMELEAQESA